MALVMSLVALYFPIIFLMADYLNDPRSGMTDRSIEFKFIASFGWPATLLVGLGLIVWDAHRARRVTRR